ncbi:DnaA regulatory inactivator Hda [Collimonas sp. NPDC087041]|uniref:DnaA regulatory inactivator Hda n=1 Tax=Collimonas arenae TaxID=279058 RepID=A0A127PVD6_9BURK|nr:DnaA regulatory inactivator Hda [Collimonas arenae]AMP01694.1 dnaA regulatory inactivator Hda [Collimonas arenae]AMP11591.1 dnaA regulatory inactivator Hda [Collimonas arenae]
MRQLTLDITAEEPQTLDTFVVGQNQEALQFLQRLVAPSTTSITAPGDRFVYLWGDAGAGKSHVLHALASSTGARLIRGNQYNGDVFNFSPEVSGYLIDDCDKLSATDQIEAFALFNQIREHGGWLVTSGELPPSELSVREDLRTRLGWGLIYQLHGLSDEEKIAALTHAAQVRGLHLSSGVLPYLITHFRRDMRSLTAMLDELDRYSLETQRPITLPLLRSLLQLESEDNKPL